MFPRSHLRSGAGRHSNPGAGGHIPLDIVWDGDFAGGEVPEDTPIDTVLGAFVPLLNLAGGSYIFTIVSDPDAKFAVDGADLVLAAELDFVLATTHTFTVRATDPTSHHYAERSFTITVTEAPSFVGPLDLYSTGALVAYSLSRALSTAWLGENVVRLRRDSDDAELDFIAGLVDGLVDQAAVTAWLAGANPFVVTAYDQSGNANDCTQATEADQPPYVTNAVGGRAAMQAVDAATTAQLICGEIVYPNGGYTGFMVVRGSLSRFLAVLTSPDDMEFNSGLGSGYYPVYIQDESGNDAGIDSDDTLDTDYHIVDARGKFHDCDVFVDGVDVGTDEFTDGAGPVGVMTIVDTRLLITRSGNTGEVGGFAEFIIYATFPSDSDRLLVRQNQQTFYSTPALP